MGDKASEARYYDSSDTRDTEESVFFFCLFLDAPHPHDKK